VANPLFFLQAFAKHVLVHYLLTSQFPEAALIDFIISWYQLAIYQITQHE